MIDPTDPVNPRELIKIALKCVYVEKGSLSQQLNGKELFIYCRKPKPSPGSKRNIRGCIDCKDYREDD